MPVPDNAVKGCKHGKGRATTLRPLKILPAFPNSTVRPTADLNPPEPSIRFSLGFARDTKASRQEAGLLKIRRGTLLHEIIRISLQMLEEEKLVALHRKGGAVTLIKATYEGLKRAKPQEYYTFFPDFVDKAREIF